MDKVVWPMKYDMPRVQEKGQVTLEAALRARLGIRAGDEVEERMVEPGDVVEKAGVLIVPKRKGFRRFRGLLAQGERTDDVMRELRGES